MYSVCDFYITGPESGLRVTLNIEQYEYMPGRHDAAGVKLLIHDPQEIPRVHARGQAIPPGSSVLVGVKLKEVVDSSWSKCLYFNAEVCVRGEGGGGYQTARPEPVQLFSNIFHFTEECAPSKFVCITNF